MEVGRVGRVANIEARAIAPVALRSTKGTSAAAALLKWGSPNADYLNDGILPSGRIGILLEACFSSLLGQWSAPAELGDEE